MTPVRLAKLLDGLPPGLAWSAVRAGTHPADPKRRFTGPARGTDVDEVGDRYRLAGVRILLPSDEAYPSLLVDDPGAPAVLFALGDPSVLDGSARVALVGTRSATHYGRQVASELGADLAAEGVVVVSGLARGIDGAAHAGAVRVAGGAPPVAVVGTGLDVVYPSSNRELWTEVAARGVVLSESALGTPPHPGVFPARNRIIAALSDVVVVVECHHNGGSIYTVDAAARRSIPVCAVPGSVMSRASDGTNALLVDGCIPVRDAADVLVAVALARTGVDHRPTKVGTGEESETTDDTDPDPDPDAAAETATDTDTDPDAAAETATDTDTDVNRNKNKSTDRERDVNRNSDPDFPVGGRQQTSPGSGISAGRLAQPVGCPAPTTRVRRTNPIVASQIRADRRLTRSQRLVWEAVDDTPTSFETILLRTDMSIASAAEVCEQLVEEGALICGAGWWTRPPVRSVPR